jgi:hypothetical protein
VFREERIVRVMAGSVSELLTLRRSFRREFCQIGVTSGAGQWAMCSEVSSGQGQQGHFTVFQALIWCIF